MEKLKVTLTADTKNWEAFIASALALVESSDRPIEARARFVDSVLELLNEGGAIDFDRPAATVANEMVIGLKPSKRLLDLVATFRAGD